MFIGLLRKHLESEGCQTRQAQADTDLLIVQTAIAAAEGTTETTFLVGDDRFTCTTVLSLENYYYKPVLPTRAPAWGKEINKVFEHC